MAKTALSIIDFLNSHPKIGKYDYPFSHQQHVFLDLTENVGPAIARELQEKYGLETRLTGHPLIVEIPFKGQRYNPHLIALRAHIRSRRSSERSATRADGAAVVQLRRLLSALVEARRHLDPAAHQTFTEHVKARLRRLQKL
ncbi:TPA: hypothetical protein HA244_01735 [Candidatus Micrarchaeota archaeon]|nr:hypothetical protein [Candidatus Micrarchaeota archaeon]